MLKKFAKTVAASALLGLSITANAGLFEFSYLFQDGTSVTGTLTGDANGQYIENVDNVTVQLNGVELATQLWDVAFVPNGTGVNGDWWDNRIDAIVSFDASLNNFLFIDSNYPTDTDFSTYFYMINENGYNNVQVHHTTGTASANPINGSAWSIAEVSVPEPGTLGLLGLGLLGVVASRRKLNKA